MRYCPGRCYWGILTPSVHKKKCRRGPDFLRSSLVRERWDLLTWTTSARPWLWMYKMCGHAEFVYRGQRVNMKYGTHTKRLDKQINMWKSVEIKQNMQISQVTACLCQRDELFLAKQLTVRRKEKTVKKCHIIICGSSAAAKYGYMMCCT